MGPAMSRGLSPPAWPEPELGQRLLIEFSGLLEPARLLEVADRLLRLRARLSVSGARVVALVLQGLLGRLGFRDSGRAGRAGNHEDGDDDSEHSHQPHVALLG